MVNVHPGGEFRRAAKRLGGRQNVHFDRRRWQNIWAPLVHRPVWVILIQAPRAAELTLGLYPVRELFRPGMAHSTREVPVRDTSDLGSSEVLQTVLQAIVEHLIPIGNEGDSRGLFGGGVMIR